MGRRCGGCGKGVVGVWWVWGKVVSVWWVWERVVGVWWVCERVVGVWWVWGRGGECVVGL